MNPVICPLRNNIHLTKKAVKSIFAQDIPVQLLLMDNGSTDGTSEWTRTQADKELAYVYFDPPKSVAASWNFGLKFWFDSCGAEYVLVCNNDIELRPDTYRRLLEDGGPFVTAVGTNDPEKIKPRLDDDGIPMPSVMPTGYARPDPAAKRPHPDFSCFLIRKELYYTVGPFDEKFKIAFCEDGDYDMRMYNGGVQAYCIDLPFLHHGSMTIKNADPKEIRKIQIQADKNRAYFKKKWGVAVGSPEYYNALGKGSPVEQ